MLSLQNYILPVLISYYNFVTLSPLLFCQLPYPNMFPPFCPAFLLSNKGW